MEIHRPNMYIDALLRWENEGEIRKRLYDPSLRAGGYIPPEEFEQHSFPDGERYFTISWRNGKAPAGVDFDVTLDRLPQDMLPPSDPPPLHDHDFFEIIYVYSGRCEASTRESRAVLQSGDICLHNLQVIHRVRPCGPGDAFFNLIIRREIFQRSFLDMLSENDIMSNFFVESLYGCEPRQRQIILRANENFRCEAILQDMIEAHYRDEPMLQSSMRASLVLLLNEMTRQYRAELSAKSEEGAKGVELTRVGGYIGGHYREITLEELSAQFGYAPRSMARYIKQKTGMTFKEIVQQIRFHQACFYLRDNRRSIDDIALLVGYAERASFDREFKKRYHITARDYRARYAAPPNA